MNGANTGNVKSVLNVCSPFPHYFTWEGPKACLNNVFILIARSDKINTEFSSNRLLAFSHHSEDVFFILNKQAFRTQSKIFWRVCEIGKGERSRPMLKHQYCFKLICLMVRQPRYGILTYISIVRGMELFSLQNHASATLLKDTRRETSHSLLSKYHYNLFLDT